MHCELIVPALLAPPAAAGAAARHPGLELLMARGRRQAGESRSLEQWLAEAFAQPGALAAGALTVAAHGGDPGGGWWTRADPVHLRVLRDRVVVAPAEAFDLSQDEADALVRALNEHFSDAAQFRTIEARRWAVKLAAESAFPESPALLAAGRDPAAARGADALLTEIQMLLHSHPVNEAREARGEPAVNSLWLWGAGRLPRTVSAPWQSVAADDPAARGLARLAGMRGETLPASAQAWLARLPEDGRHLAVLDALRAPSVLEQPAAFADAVDELERRWFAPLLEALRGERIGMVTLRVPDAAGGAFETIRGDLRRFWRRPRAIAHYAEPRA